MRYIYIIIICILWIVPVKQVFGAEEGMPQLNPEFWISQIFWLLLIFSILYIAIWKTFLPKIANSIENRKSKVINDLNEAQKLKDGAEKKLKEYNQIIENSKTEAKKIIGENKEQLDKDIEGKKEKFNAEIEKELLKTENEIQILKKNSTLNISKIAEEIASELVKELIGTEVNKSNVSAVVQDIAKKRMTKNQ